jgi:hypothetical protein
MVFGDCAMRHLKILSKECGRGHAAGSNGSY